MRTLLDYPCMIVQDASWLAGRLAGWLAGWLLAGWLAGWLAGFWLAGRPAGKWQQPIWLVWLAGWLAGWAIVLRRVGGGRRTPLQRGRLGGGVHAIPSQPKTNVSHV